MGSVAVNAMLLSLPKLEGRRWCRQTQQRFPTAAAPLSPLLSAKGILLTTALNAQLLVLLLFVAVVRATPNTEIVQHSTEAATGNNNLRFNKNGLVTDSPDIIIPRSVGASSTDASLMSPNKNNNHHEHTLLSENNNEHRPKSIRKRTSHTISIPDPLTTSLGAGRSRSSDSLAKVVAYSSTHSDRRLEPSPSSTVEQQQMNGNSFSANERGDPIDITNVTSQLQTHTYLPCKLSPSLLKQRQIANKSVSWVRVRDEHILTVDRITFITDDRFQGYYSESNGMWMLQIKWVQQRDAGIYECQVSTEPKVSAQVQLNVVVPKTELVGEQIRFVKDGSNVKMHCVVRGALEPPIYISWFYGTKQIYNDSPRGWKIKLDRNVLDNEHDGSHNSVGSLSIAAVRKRDTGNYTCSPSNSNEVTIMLHVINGDYSASAITSSSSRGRFSDLIVTIIISVVLFETT